MSKRKTGLTIPKANTSGQPSQEALSAPEVPYSPQDYPRKAPELKEAPRGPQGSERLDQTLIEGQLAGNSNFRLHQATLDRMRALESVVAMNISDILRRALAYGLPIVEEEARAKGAVIPKKLPKKVEL